MDIVSRARNIIVRPAAEWPVIDAEPISPGALYTKYLIPLGLIGPIASFIGLTVVGVSIPFLGTIRSPILTALTSAALGFGGLLAGVYLWALIIDALAPTFAGRRNVLAALKVVVFAATPALLAGVLGLIPALGMLQLLAALYALYLLYRGLPVLMKTPPDKALGYTALTVVSGIGVGLVLGVVLAALHFTPFMNPGAALSRNAGDAAAQGAIATMIGTAAGGGADEKQAAQTVAAGIMAAGKAAEAAASAAPEAPAAGATPQTASAGDDRKAVAGAAAGLAAIGTFVSGGKAHVEPVDFHALEALLPTSLGSLARTDVHGQKTNAAGLGVSEAEGTFGTSSSGLTVKITDMANASGVMAIGKLAMTIDSESDSGYERSVLLGGRKVHEKWTAASKTAELTAFVGDRFVVEVSGEGIDMPAAERALTALDLDKLAGLTG